MNNELDFISLFVYFILSVKFLFFFILGLDKSVIVTYVTVTVTQSCNTKKVVKGPRINNIIYSITTIYWPYDKHMYFRIG